MIETYDPAHLETASVRFRRFFGELRETFIERDDVLTQFAMALLSRQHVLMTGPPGTAKSQMASLVLGRIIDESTGSPSLFSRQFTENTVQTDLIGPINFKTLMESGRTEHFTEDGMLGSVHAFLDEVFDGRDMLLRSTLNILNERELKHGSTVTKGRIECAFMTSNRYIAELLDNARQTLLAFIDRISFISFIPRGFAQDDSLRTVVRRHGGRFGRHTPTEYLSVQDLDVLQAVVDMVYIPAPLCDAVARLIELLDRELGEAQRADPKFQPTRYLSTRTAVQATHMLRVAAVLDKVFRQPARPLQATPEDLASLRYTLLLNGMPAHAIAARVQQETDPRELRQLDIMRTEAEIFERCLRKLPKISGPLTPARLDLGALREQTRRAHESGNAAALTKTTLQLLSAAESGASDATDVAPLLRRTVGALSEQVLLTGLTPTLAGEDPLTRVAEQVYQLTDALERAAGVGRPLALWLQARLLALLDEALQRYPAMTAETITLLANAPLRAGVSQQIERRLASAESLRGLRRRLQPRGDAASAAEAGDPWQRALANLERELTLLWDAKFRLATSDMLKLADDTPLTELLRGLSAVLTELNADAARLRALGRDDELVRAVAGERVEPVVRAALSRVKGHDREDMISQYQRVVAHLRDAGLGDAIAPSRFVAWAVQALARAERPPASTPAPRDRASFLAARAQESPLSITGTLLRVGIAALPLRRVSVEDPEATSDAVREVLRALEPRTRRQIINLDLNRARRVIRDLEAWWSALRDADQQEPGLTLLEQVVASGFLTVMRGDGVPLRLTSELARLDELFPESAEKSAELRARLAELDAASTNALVARLESRAERAWDDALAPRSER